MLCNDWPVQHIYPVFLSYRKSPEVGKWHLAPSSPQAPQCPGAPIPCQQSEHWSDTVRGCQHHTWMSPRARAASRSQCHLCCPCTGALELCRDQSRTGSISLLLFSKAEGSLVRIWVTQRAAGALCHSAPGQDGPWTQAGSLPCSQEKAGWKLHRGNQLPFPIPCPCPSHSESPQMTHEEKSDSISEKRSWN